METEYGSITYIRKLSGLWATSYDSTCPGCSGTTATGMKQGYGVVTVDPKIIPLYRKLYIPGNRDVSQSEFLALMLAKLF